MTEDGRGDRLPLQFGPRPGRLPERVTPMRPTEGDGPFDDPGYFFEPWWPGIRAFVYVEHGNVRLHAESLADPRRPSPSSRSFRTCWSATVWCSTPRSSSWIRPADRIPPC